MKFFMLLFFFLIQSTNLFACGGEGGEICPSAPSYETCFAKYVYIPDANSGYTAKKIVSNFELDIYFAEGKIASGVKALPTFATLRIQSVFAEEGGKLSTELVKFGALKKDLLTSETEQILSISGDFFYFHDDDENYYRAMDFFGKKSISFKNNIQRNQDGSSTATGNLIVRVETGDGTFKDEVVPLTCDLSIW